MAPQATTVNLSNQMDSPSSSDGYVVGQSGSAVGFYGATPVAQPLGNAQAALSRGLAGGVIATYHSTQSPSSVTTTTTAEQNLTIQSGTGFQMQLLANDIVFVNKPASQAGLSVGNVRVQASNVLGVTFGNATTSNISITASEAYGVVAIRGLPRVSATLSPAAVAANTTVEQIFSVTGIMAGSLVHVIKPAAQAGLDILGVRAAGNNSVGVTFANFTATAITPTASEAYQFVSLLGMDAVNNEVDYGFNVGTVGAVGSGVVITGGATSLTGLLASDVVAGIFKPTAQAAATNNSMPCYGIPTANTLTLYFFGVGTGITPTASEVYGIKTIRLAPAAPLVLYNQVLSPTSVASLTSAEQTFTVTGLVASSPVWVNKPSAQPGLGIGGVRVSALNTLAINFVNLSSAAITPSSESYVIGNFQVPLPGAGNCVYQSASAVINSLGNLSNAQRSALVALGLMAGA